MANVKFTENQYIGSQEINRLKSLLKNDGYKKLFRVFMQTLGVVMKEVDSTALQVYQGTISGSISVRLGEAVDGDLEIISVLTDQVNALVVAPDSVLRYVYIRHIEKVEEEGTVTISADGLVTGVGTKFTEVLRGNPSNGVKIRFTNSAGNTSDYEVAEVGDDTHLYLSTPNLVPEIDLTYAVVGSFAPGVVVDDAQKLIYSYDSYELRIDDVGIAGTDILLAQVRNDGTTTEIFDLRALNQFKLFTNI